MKQDFPLINWDVSKTIEEVEVKRVTGDGMNEEDTGVEYPVKPIDPETVWINSGSEANPDDAGIVKGHGVRFFKGDGLETPLEDTVEIDKEEK